MVATSGNAFQMAKWPWNISAASRHLQGVMNHPPTAAAEWPGVVRALCAHRADTGDRLTAYLQAHPGDVIARALMGFAALLLGRADRLPAAAAAEAAARQGLSAGSADDRRARQWLDVLRDWRHDRPLAAAEGLDRLLSSDPRDLLAVKLQHSLFLMSGQPARMRASLERVLPAWDRRDPDTGFVLGCYAFALEETGEFERAEIVGREAVARQPHDAWAIHAVTHVFESLGRAREGAAWLADHEAGYAGCNVFLGHVHWHRALLHLQIGDAATALDIYDRHVATPWSGDYRDMSNAVSLLWRLEHDGIDVGGRWQRLAAIAVERAHDHRSAFALAHYVAALVHGGDDAAVTAALAAMPVSTDPGSTPDSQAAVVATVTRPLCDGIAALHAGHGEDAYAALAPLEHLLPRLGGSNAQRDLFLLMLIESALAAGETTAAARAIATRQRLRPHDPWLRARARLLKGVA